MNLNPNALEKRTYKYKKSTLEFICPLCGTGRAFTLKPQITLKNYLHMFMITAVLMLITYPLMGIKSAWLFFLVWGVYECVLRMLFRKEVPCPHCGFDASWYQKDVKVARQKVEEFWQMQNQMKESTLREDIPVVPDEEPILDEIAPY